MGAALLPKIVLDTFTGRRQLSVTPMRGRYRSARTLLVWRRDQPSARVKAFAAAIEAAGPRSAARRTR